MKLYYLPGACSLSPHIVARELGITLELEKVDLATQKAASRTDFLEFNRKGYLPALQRDGGSVLPDGPAIVQYPLTKSPGKCLRPQTAPSVVINCRENSI